MKSSFNRTPCAWAAVRVVVQGARGVVRCAFLALAAFAAATAAGDDFAYRKLGRDRVLLMNNDSNTLCPIDHQGYYDTNTTEVAYWVHDGGEPTTPSDALARLNLMAGTNHTYYATLANDDGTVRTNKWVLQECRAGSAAAPTTSSSAGRAYLPWSPTSEPLEYGYYAYAVIPIPTTAPATTSNRRGLKQVATVTMRNTTNAKVFSPHYADGIGDIFFDAVNGWTARSDTLRIYASTNTVGGVDFLGDDYDINADMAWIPLSADVYAVVNCSGISQVSGNTEDIVLNSTVSTSNRFFRVHADVQRQLGGYKGPCCFKIERANAINTANAESEKDYEDLVLIDNILVTYPRAGLELSQYGREDESYTGVQVVGHGGAWSVPFPAAGETDVLPRAKYDVDVAGLPEDEAITVNAEIDKAVLHYRWRYLKQQTNNWAEIELSADSATATLSSTEPFDLPDAVGDVEYYFAATYRATHYKPVDYAFGTAKAPEVGYSTAYTNLFSATLQREGEETFAKGTDYFFRLRNARSNYEAFGVDLRWGDDYVSSELNEEYIPMELTADGTWRGIWQIPAAADGKKFYFAFNGSNPQVAGSTEWVDAQEWWMPSTAVENWPASGLVRKVDGRDDMRNQEMEVDISSGAVIFTFEENAQTYSVARGEYQNFNKWGSAKGVNFTGNSVVTSGVSRYQSLSQAGVRSWVTNYLMGAKKYSAGRNDTDLWEESFDMSLYTLEDRMLGVEQSCATPNGWEMENGMFVAEAGKTNGVAAQLHGQGMGSLEFDNVDRPQGIDNVSLRARLGRKVDFESFSVMDGNNKSLVSNYVVAAKILLGKDEQYISPTEPSASLVTYYRATKGAYEMRVHRICTAATATNAPAQRLYYLEVQLNRWDYEDEQYAYTNLFTALVGSNSPVTNDTATLKRYPNVLNTTLCGTAATDYTTFYLGTYSTANSVKLLAGICLASNNDTVNANLSTPGRMLTFEFEDTSSARLSQGTYGVGANDCLAYFKKIFATTMPTSNIDATETFGGNETTLVSDENARFDNSWALPRMSVHSDLGETTLKVNDLTQTLNLCVKPYGTREGWITVTNVAVSSFNFTNSNVPLRYPESCTFKITTGGTTKKSRVDVVVDDISFTRLRGTDDPMLASRTYDWTFTEAWPRYNITTNSSGNRISIVTNSAVISLAPCRSVTNLPVSIRSPLLTNGVSVFGFTWTNVTDYAQAPTLLIQTNNVSSGYIYGESTTLSDWHTVAEHQIINASGSFALPLKMRAATNTAIRVILDPALIEKCSTNKSLSIDYCKVDITGVYYWDDPALSGSYWWGWNMRTVGESDSDGAWQYLPDASVTDSTGVGLSAILNSTCLATQDRTLNTNDVSGTQWPSGIDPNWTKHSSFIQSPYASNGIGRISFSARVFDTTNRLDNAGNERSAWYPSTIALYGAQDADAEDDDWEIITNFTAAADGTTSTNEYFAISNITYRSTYSWETHDPAKTYKVVRLAVRGAERGYLWNNHYNTARMQPNNYSDTHSKMDMMALGPEFYKLNPTAEGVQRVALDEIVMSEIVVPKLGFLNALPFREDIDGTNSISDVELTSLTQQPLLEESFGFQVQIVPEQMKDLIDLNSVIVSNYYYIGDTPWGFANWSNNCTAVELPKAADWSIDRMVYRSRADVAPDSIVPAVYAPENTQVASQTMQYNFSVHFKDTDGNWHEFWLSDETARYWSNPSWYGSLDRNAENTFGTSDPAYIPYTILETISPHRAWFNEINLWDCEEWDAVHTNQFVEIAVPVGVSLKGWELKLYERDLDHSYTMAYVGEDGVADAKSDDALAAANYAFLAIKSPKSTCASSGSWRQIGPYNRATNSWDGTLDVTGVYAMELIRPSKIVEHQVVFSGLNYYAGTISEKLYDPLIVYEAITNSTGNTQWVYLGADETVASLGVYTNTGSVSSEWKTTARVTPGLANVFDPDDLVQYIDPGWYLTPNGDSCWIRSYIQGEYADLLEQSVGEGSRTAIFRVRKDDGETNIVYKAAPWYMIDTFTVNEETNAEALGLNTYVYNIKNPTNDIRIVVGAAKNYSKLEGVDDASIYRNDIFDWVSGLSADEEKDLYLADFYTYGSAISSSKLTLPEMYWLDISPFTTNAFYMGIDAVPENLPQVALDAGGNLTNFYGDVVLDGPDMYHPVLTNFGVTVHAVISNQETHAVHAPQYLQGLNRTRSTDTLDSAWVGGSFKVRGYLLDTTANMMVPLRSFVFGSGSFTDATDPDPFSAWIEIEDPFSSASPASNRPFRWSLWDDAAGKPMWRGHNVFWDVSLDDESDGTTPAILVPKCYLNAQ